MSKNAFSKSLKGSGNVSSKLLGSIEDAILSTLAGGVSLSNVDIDGGIINNVVIGSDGPGPIFATTIQSGTPSGQGYMVCFYGLTVGDSACWLPLSGTWQIKGKLTVRDTSTLGNLLVSGNTISAVNNNGNLNLTANGTGKINLNSGVTQSSATGNVSFSTPAGTFSVFAGNPITLATNNNFDLTTKQKDISVKAGISPDQFTITNMTPSGAGGTTTVTTTVAVPYSVGESIKIFSTSTTADNYYTVTGVSGNTFQVQLPATISIASPITTGVTSYRSDINLFPDDFVNISVNKKLTFGGNQNIYGNSLGDLFVTPVTNRSLILPDNNPIQFGSNTRTISSNGTGIVVNTPLYYTAAPITTITTSANIQDRGIEFNYNQSGNKTGFFGYDTSKHLFTYLTDTTNNNGVISGTPGDFEIGNLIVNGTITGGNITGGGTSNTVERLSLTNLSVTVSPSAGINITFISVTTSSIITGVLPAGISDGFLKYISISSLASGAQYRLTCPTGRLVDPGSGSSVGKTLVFDCPGQGVQLVWDNVLLAYLIVNSGASLV
jgi:hypothetical protein